MTHSIKVKVIVNERTHRWETLDKAFQKASFELGLRQLTVGELSPGDAYPGAGGAVVFLHNPAATPFRDRGLDEVDHGEPCPPPCEVAK